MNTHMSARESDELAQAVNHFNANRIQQAERRTTAAMGVLLAIAIGITLAMLLVDWTTPCDLPGALCTAAAIPTKTTLWRRITMAWRRLYLRACLSQARDELKDLETDLAHSIADCERLPMQIKAHRVWIDAHMDELDGLDMHPHQRPPHPHGQRN